MTDSSDVRTRGPHGHFVRDPTKRAAKISRSLRGNMNSVVHGWRLFWKRRGLREGDRWILPLLRAYGAGIASDKGEMSEAEKRMAELAQLARGCTLLVLAEAAKDGGLVAERKGPDLPAALGRFMAIEATCLKTLGLERRAKVLPSLRAEVVEPRPPA